MRINTIPVDIYNKLPHQIGQRAQVECRNDGIIRAGVISNIIGYDGGTRYTVTIRLDNGMIVPEALPETVTIL